RPPLLPPPLNPLPLRLRRPPPRAPLARSTLRRGREGRVFGRPAHLKGWNRRAERQSRPPQLRPTEHPSLPLAEEPRLAPHASWLEPARAERGATRVRPETGIAAAGAQARCPLVPPPAANRVGTPARA